MGVAFLAFFIELALGAGFWFIWKPLAFFFAILAIGGLARHIAGRITSETRKMAVVLAVYYVFVGLVLALAVYYGALLSGNGVPLKIGLGIWGLIGAQYAHVRKPGHFIGAAPAYTLFILVLFLH